MPELIWGGWGRCDSWHSQLLGVCNVTTFTDLDGSSHSKQSPLGKISGPETYCKMASQSLHTGAHAGFPIFSTGFVTLCMHMCMHACTYVRTSGCTYVHIMYLRLFPHIYIYTYVRMYVRVYVYADHVITWVHTRGLCTSEGLKPHSKEQPLESAPKHAIREAYPYARRGL